MTELFELEDDFNALSASWTGTELEPWLALLPRQITRGLSQERFGDLPRWRRALAALPDIDVSAINLDAPRVGFTDPLPPDKAADLEQALRGLHPWRKGPFQLGPVHIDTEWHSDWKWDRLLPGLRPLAGKRVLDVGCGSGYHCWRMLGAGAREVIGIEPTPLFILQFKAIQHYLRQPSIHLIPTKMEQLPRPLKAFDTVFSMGVLYHRRSPLDHLLELRDALAPGGQLLLETLVVNGDEQTVWMPPGRYARMGNVWFLPSPEALCQWLKKVGFRTPRIVNIDITSTEEQRSTSWMTFHSLPEFLDPDDLSRTIEGHPAPMRAIITADAP
jgi:tRNA (mo5U34)-methyltransferase